MTLQIEIDHGEAISLLPPSSADLSPLRSWRVKKSRSFSSASIPQKPRSINFISLGFIAYLAIAGGPFGIEVAVNAAGPLPVLIAVIILPFAWGVPQALMTAELSCMMDENGGYILWVRRGLGDFAGWVNAFNAMASNILDLPIYPILFSSYIEAYLTGHGIEMTSFGRWFIKAVALLFVFCSNVFGMRVVALSSILMSIFVLAPFVLEPIAIHQFYSSVWGQVAPNINWSLFLSTMIWNYQGWDSLGCIAGEVHNGSRAYPLAILIALLLITVNYSFPVAAGVIIEPDITLWKEGMLETIAIKVGDWCGIWVGLAAIVATVGAFNVVMACSSRALWATASYKMLPNCLTAEWGKYNTPIAAIIFQTITTGFLMSFPLSSLLVLDTFFNNLTLLLEFLAYIRLKYTEPKTKRPFVVPGGMVGAWAITLPKSIVISGVLLAQETHVWYIAAIFNAFVIIGYFIWSQFHEHSKFSPSLPPHPHC